MRPTCAVRKVLSRYFTNNLPVLRVLSIRACDIRGHSGHWVQLRVHSIPEMSRIEAVINPYKEQKP